MSPDELQFLAETPLIELTYDDLIKLEEMVEEEAALKQIISVELSMHPGG